MSPKAKRELAREHLETARDDVADSRAKEAINALFYAAEAAVVAIVDVHGVETKRSHRLKADAASELHASGVIDTDFGPMIRQLNQARKDAWYEGDEPELDQSLEETLASVETLVAAAEAQG